MARWLCTIFNLVVLLSLVFHSSAYESIDDKTLEAIPDAGNDFDIDNGALLAPILIPRVPGTEGNDKVLNHLVNFFHESLPEWTLKFQNSSSRTPASGNNEVPFRNLIARRSPSWAREGETSYLTLAAHFDSKLTPDGFIGAIDSAAPCAMLMHAARSLEPALSRKWKDMKAQGQSNYLETAKGVQLIFFDGEEAFKFWSKDDSIYGARSLAAEWENIVYEPMSTFKNPIASIELFVLLDLLGSKNPRIPSYFMPTHWAYAQMADLERRLRKLGLFKSSPNHKSKKKADTQSRRRDEPLWFHEVEKKDTDRWLGGIIGDDHEPFLDRGVEVLHIIPSPFPPVWHQISDNGKNLDIPTVEDWTRLVTAFAAEWMELDGLFPNDKKTTRSDTARRNIPKSEL